MYQWAFILILRGLQVSWDSAPWTLCGLASSSRSEWKWYIATHMVCPPSILRGILQSKLISQSIYQDSAVSTSIPLAKLNHITKPRNQRGYSSLTYRPHQRWECVGCRKSTAGHMTSWPQPPRPVDFLGGGASFEIISQLRGGSCWYKWELSIVIYERKDTVKEKASAAS